MELHLTKNLLSLETIKIADTLVREFANSYPEYLNKDYIKSVDPVQDYVKEFVEYYINDQEGIDALDDATITYIVNRLYAVKSGPQVFEVMGELFSTTDKVIFSWEYPFPVIEILDINVLKISNVIVYINKLKTALEYLLFGKLLRVTIQNLILRLTGDLSDYTTIHLSPYYEIDVHVLN